MKRKLIPLFFVLLFTFGCWEVPEDITIPEWDSNYNLPLTTKHYLLKELIKTDEYISIDENFVYTVSHSDLSTPHGIGEYLEGKLDQSREDITIPIVDGNGKSGLLLSDGMELDSAYIESGTMNVSVQNNTTGTVQVSIVLPGFISSVGNPLTMTQEISSGSSYDFVEDLSGYKFLSTMQEVRNDSIQINGSISGETSDGELMVDYSFTNSIFSYIAGKIPPTKIETVQTSMSLPITDDIEDMRDKVSFHSAELTIFGEYLDNLLPSDPNEPFPINIDNLKLVGMRNNNSEEIYLKYNDRENNNLGPFLIDDGSFTQTFTSENTNLSDFLSFMPDSIFAIVESTANPNSDRGAATNRDSIQVSFDFIIKSIVTVSELTYTDTTELKIDEDARTNIEDFKAATVYNKIDNKVGFGGKLVMHFTDASHNILFTLDTINFESASVDNEGNTIIQHSEPTVELDSSQVQKLAMSYNIIMDVIIDTKDSDKNQKVIFKSEDWLDIISFCTVKYHVNLND